jgi:hypothetical protein
MTAVFCCDFILARVSMRRLNLIVAAVLLGPSTVGCEAWSVTGGDQPIVSIQTDQASYRTHLIGGEGTKRTYSFNVVTRLENRGTAPAYLSVCRDGQRTTPLYSSQLVNGDSLASGYVVVWACAGTQPVRLDPGTARVDTLRFLGPSRRDGRTGEPYPLQALEGDFQAFFVISSCPAEVTCPLPIAETKSNVFHVALGS